MPSSRKRSKAAPFNPLDLALSHPTMAKAGPYVRRLIEDDQLRHHLTQAIESSRHVYGRVSDGRAPRQLLEDRKMQRELMFALAGLRDATLKLTEPVKRKRKRRGFGRLVMVAIVGGVVALVVSETLRSKLLDLLFGKEETFDYTPPASPTPAPGPDPAEPVSAA